MSPLRTLCVFCGHASGGDPRFMAAAGALGRLLADRGVELVYGGGHVGMMGALAESMLRRGGRVMGVIPDFLMRRERAYLEITELVVVQSMEARKRLMMDRSDAFCILPGGFGTMDEAFEVITQKQLGLLPKPIVLVNVGGCFDGLITMIHAIVGQGFAARETERLYTVVASVDEALAEIDRQLVQSTQDKAVEASSP